MTIDIGRIIGTAFAGALIGATSVVFCISFAAVVYTGDLDVFLSRGIGLTLIGGALMAVVCTFTLSDRGTICQPQDVTAALLSLSAASIAATGIWAERPEDLFATVATLIAMSTFVAGVAALFCGRMRLGRLVRFIPYPVLGGFLAATGYLLTLGAIGMSTDQNVTLSTLPDLLEPGISRQWIAWLLAGAAIATAAQMTHHPLVLPFGIAAVLVAFYGWMAATGLGFAEAEARGLLLGPFKETRHFLSGIDPAFPAHADWRIVVDHTPTIAAVAGMTIIGALLNAAGLELANGSRIDYERDLSSIGVANIAAAGAGGLVGYHLLGETLLARKLNMRGATAGISAAIGCLLAAFFGGSALSVLPIGLFASVIAYLGVDLLWTWLWHERERLPGSDYLVVLLILLVAATIGFLEAIGVGLLAASMLFVLACSQTDIVRLRTTAASRRSRVERDERDIRRLANLGQSAVIYELSGYIFFGTANSLVERISTDIAEADPPLSFVLLDFKRVSGADSTATFALGKLMALCEKNGIGVHLSGASTTLRADWRRAGIDPAVVHPSLDDTLRGVEEHLLADASESDRRMPDLLRHLASSHPDVDLATAFEPIAVEDGGCVIEEGAQSDSLYVLESGQLRAEIRLDGHVVTVARFLPGALIGEIGLYGGVPRTASIIAEEPSRLLRIESAALDRLCTERPAFAADFHKLAAGYLARRLMRTTSLMRDADL